MLTVILALAAAEPAGAVPAATPVRQWLSKPTGYDIARVYPAGAVSKQLSGRAIVECQITQTGFLQRCEIDAEAPTGENFGAAALALTPKFRVTPSPPQYPGYLTTPVSDASGYVVIPIRFSMNNNPQPKYLTITAPKITSAPGFALMAAAYPPTAAGVGNVEMLCHVEDTGKLSQCDIGREEPSGRGFGNAALTLADRFQLSEPRQVYSSGNPVLVGLWLHFAPPNDEAFQQKRIGQPNWLEVPDPAQAVALFPPEATSKGLHAGRGVVEIVSRCVV